MHKKIVNCCWTSPKIDLAAYRFFSHFRQTALLKPNVVLTDNDTVRTILYCCAAVDLNTLATKAPDEKGEKNTFLSTELRRRMRTSYTTTPNLTRSDLSITELAPVNNSQKRMNVGPLTTSETSS